MPFYLGQDYRTAADRFDHLGHPQKAEQYKDLAQKTVEASMWTMFAFVATSADIYIVRFGLSQQAYGFYFAIISMAMLVGVGAGILVRVSEKVKGMTMIRLGFGEICLFSGAFILFIVNRFFAGMPARSLFKILRFFH